MIRRLIVPAFFTLALAATALDETTLCSLAQSAGSRKYPDPTPREEQILKRFAEEFVVLTPGRGQYPASFAMGSATGPAEEMPRHTVTFQRPFAVGRYEVTQELYEVVMGVNPSRWKGTRNAVEMVSWPEAKKFCQKATTLLHRRKLLAPTEEIRLPTEAQWEYACRAGSTTAYAFGADAAKLGDYAWFRDNSKGYDPPVGAKKPNAWGLYDMHGYNWEWCEDDWQPNYVGAAADGSPRKAPRSGEKVIRGGSWAHPADACRSAFREHRPAGHQSDTIGFRCVRAPIRNSHRKGSNDAP